MLCVAVVMSGCGGGGGTPDTPATAQSTREYRSLASVQTGTVYPLSVYLPPASAGPRGNLPVIYLLDGDSWFEPLVASLESTRTRAVVVAIHTAGQRNRDFVPANSCTANGGGQAAFLAFLRNELFAFIETSFGGDPARRLLFGHSHGGTFVLFALFAQAPGTHAFAAYLSSEASIACATDTVHGWERDYANASRRLPVRLHLSFATEGNAAANRALDAVMTGRGYEQLVYQAKGYVGTHSGIITQVLPEAVAFGLGDSR